MKRFTQAGFTLLEILIASVILFSMLSLGALGFKNARLNSEHAADTVFLLAPMPMILDTIQQQIREKADAAMEGEGSLQGVVYEWHADELSFCHRSQNTSSNQILFVNYSKRFRLYQVNLTLSYRGKSRVFSYRRLHG